MVAGHGTIVDGEIERPLGAGDVVFVAPNDVHQFRNTGTEPMRFLCLIPNSATGRKGDGRTGMRIGAGEVSVRGYLAAKNKASHRGHRVHRELGDLSVFRSVYSCPLWLFISRVLFSS